MKNKKMFIIILLIFIMLLVPIPIKWKNNIIEYRAILYKYTKVHTPSEISFTGYEDGWELKILGIRVGGNIKVDDILKTNENLGSIIFQVVEDTRTPKGAMFILKNNTLEEYSYIDAYTIEKFENKTWKEIDTLNKEPLSWNDMLYILKPNEEKKINIDWSLGYGKLKNGTYRLVKNSFRKSNSPDSRSYTIYAEFDIK